MNLNGGGFAGNFSVDVVGAANDGWGGRLRRKNISTKPGVPVMFCGVMTAIEFAETFRERILRGEFLPGERLPPIRKITKQTGLTYSIVSRGLNDLCNEGLIEQRQGSGTFVRDWRDSKNQRGRPERTNRQRTIGILLPPWGDSASHYMAGAILKGASSEGARHGHRIEFIHAEKDRMADYEFGDEVLALRLDGLIWVQPPADIKPAMVRLIHSGVALVFTGRGFRNLPVPYVHEDFAAFGEAVASAMVADGRSELVCIAGRSDDLHSSLRVAAVAAALANRGMSFPSENVVTGHITGSDHLYSLNFDRIVKEFLDVHPNFDAVLTFYPQRIAPLFELHQSKRRTCPEDFSLISLDQSPIPTRELWGDLPLTAIVPPQENIGRAAVRELEAVWGIQASELEPIDLSPRIIL